jgi:hypothetical protein
LIALNKNGKELWRWRTRQRFIPIRGVAAVGLPALIYVADTGKALLLTWTAWQGRLAIRVERR